MDLRVRGADGSAKLVSVGLTLAHQLDDPLVVGPVALPQLHTAHALEVDPAWLTPTLERIQPGDSRVQSCESASRRRTARRSGDPGPPLRTALRLVALPARRN